MLCNNEKLAKTSGSPGKTQLINHFEITSVSGSSNKAKPIQWYLVDLPGYGFAKVSISSRRRWEQMIENYLRKRENLTKIFVLIDARHTPQKIDLEFLEQLKPEEERIFNERKNYSEGIFNQYETTINFILGKL